MCEWGSSEYRTLSVIYVYRFYQQPTDMINKVVHHNYLLLLLYNIYLFKENILYGEKSMHILNPLKELYQSSLVSIQSYVWKMTNIFTFEL